ncbi:MAG: hypothetical protein IPQ04_03375 [Saprospiraceae bacterium]|jgi:hypothetical protein|nr:hypothetical protein [Saprospiraceae bacterium]
MPNKNLLIILLLVLLISHHCREELKESLNATNLTRYPLNASSTLDFLDNYLDHFEATHGRKMIYCGKFFVDSLFNVGIMDGIRLRKIEVEIPSLISSYEFNGNVLNSNKKFVHVYDNIPSLSIIYCCQDGVNSILYSIGPNLIDENGLGDDYVQGTKMLDYME